MGVEWSMSNQNCSLSWLCPMGLTGTFWAKETMWMACCCTCLHHHDMTM